MATLGWIGLGEIGTPMALQLIRAGHQVVVWGRTASRLQPVLDAGATAAASPAELAAQCEGVLLCVTDGDAVEEVVFGPRGVAEGARRGAIVVDHSTIHPETTRLASRRLRSAGVAWVDAPVSGGSRGAQAGTLSVFLGGEEADVARVRPWIAAYAGNVTHMGAVGSGQVTKSCNQAIVAATVGMWAEVISYARRCGIDPDLMIDALEGGWADSAIRRVHAHDFAAGRFRRTPGLIILKDLDIIGDMARATKSPMPVTEAVTTLWRLLLAQGHAPGSFGAIMQLYADIPHHETDRSPAGISKGSVS
ncbi:MAG TPA: NAD(P)-dependent oxidoreductase [Candidatus Elarobacter sp.]|jgi:3-hydroxyisobutyrate dehydrogenase-like beta-hydroxyacid dehydrogenase|nr:NAD(P)-dependent oxidoreductase [Candidatus Elarobacter sp.]